MDKITIEVQNRGKNVIAPYRSMYLKNIFLAVKIIGFRNLIVIFLIKDFLSCMSPS